MRLYKEEYLEINKITMDKNLLKDKTWFKIGLLSSVKQK